MRQTAAILLVLALPAFAWCGSAAGFVLLILSALAFFGERWLEDPFKIYPEE